MLPPSLIQYDPDMLLKYFSAKFVEKYDVAVVSALHHNKAKTNLHIHLIFSERQAFDVPEHPERVVAALRILAHKTGAYGMLGGQSVDVMNEKHRQTKIDQNMLNYIYENKTSALIEASMMVGAVLAGAKEEQLAEVEQTAKSIGLAFQIQDDILDATGTTEELGKPAGSDEKNEKTTYVTLFGVEGAAREVEAYTREARRLLAQFPGEHEFLEHLLIWLASRKK